MIGFYAAGAMGSGVPAPSYATEVAADGPLHWWRLGETTGSFANSGSSSVTLVVNAGTPVRGEPSLVGDSNGSVRFSSGAQRIVTDSTLSASAMATNKTIELVFRAPTGSSGTIASLAASNTPTTTGGARDRTIYIGTDGKLRCGVWTGARSIITSSAAVDDGNRHIVQFVFGADSTEGCWAYLDGTLIGSFSGVSTDTSGNRYFCVGYVPMSDWPDGSDAAAQITVDEVAIYDYKLSSGRCLAHAQAAGIVP